MKKEYLWGMDIEFKILMQKVISILNWPPPSKFAVPHSLIHRSSCLYILVTLVVTGWSRVLETRGSGSSPYRVSENFGHPIMLVQKLQISLLMLSLIFQNVFWNETIHAKCYQSGQENRIYIFVSLYLVVFFSYVYFFEISNGRF